jgi:ATP-dependent RNA helicase DDX27
MDPFLVRRESTLILLALKSFRKRVIVFFNEKRQCGRVHALFAAFGLKAVQVHGNLTQQERLENVEKFQRGEVDFLLATDLVARGLDISAVKAVLNFGFPVEPKRYLHRIGRTARAGAHGVSVTLCNDEERKDIKKLLRKLNQNLSTYMVAPKLIKMTHDFIAQHLDTVIHEVDLEVAKDRELENAYKEAQRAENMIKYKEEIMSRPKAEWHRTMTQKKELRKEARKDIANIRERFDNTLTTVNKNKKKRELKREEKAANATLFDDDKEAKNKPKSDKPREQREQRPPQAGDKRLKKSAE